MRKVEHFSFIQTTGNTDGNKDDRESPKSGLNVLRIYFNWCAFLFYFAFRLKASLSVQ